MLYDADYYWSLLGKEDRGTIGFAIATNAIYAAKFGICESRNIMDREWLVIASMLKKSYGNYLTADQVLTQMKSFWVPEQ